MDKPRPYITAALLCENVLEENNGSLSVIRIADRIEWELQGAPEGTKPVVLIRGLVSLKSGPFKGDGNIQIKVVRPNGEIKKTVISLPLKLSGGDQGANRILNISLAIEEDGLHWFDVYFEGDLLTRMPLMVVQKQPEPQKK